MKKRFKILAVALAAAVACAALAGCNSKRAADAGSAASGGASGAAGTADTFTFAQGADPRGLDPALVDDGESAKIMCNIYEGLLKYNKDSTEVEPCLAEELPAISEDQKTYTFKLRKGVKFHDGTDFNAEAAKKSIDRQLESCTTADGKQETHDTSNMPYASFVFGSIKAQQGVKEVRAKDDYTLEIELFSPQTAFIQNMAMALAAPIVSPTALEKNNGNLNEAPCGTGPYKFVSWTKGQNVVLKANPDYWGEKAKTENVIVRFIKENSARVVALTNGEVDAIDGIDSTVVDQITSAGDKLFTSEGMNINYMAYNTTSETFKNADARKAFSEAIDVSTMVKSLYSDYAAPATSIMPTFMAGYSDSIHQTAFNKEAAKADLQKAGITKVKMITYTNPRPYNAIGGQTLAESIQGYLKDVGVTCEIRSFDWTTYKDEIKKGDYDICFYGWNGDNGDPDNFMNLLSNQDPTMNVARYNNAEYNALITKGLATPNGDERNAVYTQAEQMAADQNVWLPISHAKNLCAYSPKVSGFYFHQTAVTPFAGVTKSA